MDNQVDEPGIIAIHEAGHIVMAWLLKLRVESAEVGELGGMVNLCPTGLTVLAFSGAPNAEMWEYAKRLIQTKLAGRCAEKVFFGYSLSPDSIEDIVTARAIAYSFEKQKNLPDIEEEVYEILIARKDAIRRVAQTLKQKKKLSASDLAVMQEEFTHGKEELCLAADRF